MNPIAIINDDKTEEGKQELKNNMSSYSSYSLFQEDTWILDKKKKSYAQSKDKYTLRFNTLNDSYTEITKYFALIRLEKGRSVSTVSSNICGLKVFYDFLKEGYGDIPLSKVNKSIIMDFEYYLRDQDGVKSSKESIWGALNVFFPTMKEWKDTPDINVVGKSNPFSRTAHERILSHKYIPQYVVAQLDKIFMGQDLPLYFRVFYWICRLIPSRVGEVTPIDIECILPYGNEYALKLYMYKQNGGYIEPETRLIAIKYEDMGKYLIDLIREQKEVALKLQKSLPENKRGYLLTYIPEVYRRGKYTERDNDVTILNENIVGDFFRTLSERYKLVDENNDPYIITSHKLRHNAITDRIYEGFSLLQIRDMTGHKTTEMLTKSYIHYDEDKIIEKTNLINQESKQQILFRGKILNPQNPNIVNMLLQKPRSHKIGRLGICSDISGCKGDMFECLDDCEYFIPDADELEYYEEQVELWEEKVNLFRNNQYMRENAEYNLSLHRNVVIKIKNELEGGE